MFVGRRWRVEWTKTPQPIKIQLKLIRGLRDKAPAGRYVLMISLYDRYELKAGFA